MEKEIRISNNLNEIVVLASFIEELGEELSLPAETVMNINLALEEAVANIILYAYPPKEQHIILSLIHIYWNRSKPVACLHKWKVLSLLRSPAMLSQQPFAKPISAKKQEKKK